MKIKLFWIILLGNIWGLGYPIARFITTHNIKPLNYTFWQTLIPAILLFLIVKLSRSKILFSKQHILFYFVAGFFGIALPNANMYFSAAHLPAGILAMLINTSLLIIYVLSLITGLEKFSWQRLSGVIVATAGIMLMILPKSSLPSAAMIPWVIIALITPLCFALCAIFIVKHQPKDINSLQSATGTLIAATIMLTPVVLATRNLHIINIGFTNTEWIMLIGVLLPAFGYIVLFKILATSGAVYYSLVSPIVLLTGVFWGWLMLGETLNHWTIAAAILIIMGIILVTIKQKVRQSNS